MAQAARQPTIQSGTATRDAARLSPTVFTERGYRFFFFSREERRMHIHVRSDGCEAKFWLEPVIESARNFGYTQRQLRDIAKIVEAREDELKEAWHQHFGDRGH